MFLAWNEIVRSKLRYGLIISVMFLIAYLVFFLTGLAYGLASDNRTAVDKWQADGIVLSDESNTNINMSMIPIKSLKDVDAKEKATLGQTAAVIQLDKKGAEKINASFFGINKDEFLMPNIIEGKAFANENETVVDNSLKEEEGVKLGDTLKLAGNDKQLKVVGFTDNAKFNVAPVLYVSTAAFQQIRFEKTDTSENARVNAIVFRAKDGAVKNVQLNEDGLTRYSIKEFINKLPGYNAQVLTFGFMIGFLIVIAAIVIGIFIYVLTMQKANIFGIMKAQGISGFYIAVSVIVQTFILAVLGIALGLLGTVGTALVLPTAVPFQTNWSFFLAIGGIMLVIAVLGALFSVRTIVKIDPLKAIG
ncbi:ABC transporter permease [Enterococcus ureilyticus]|uniref:Putative hemin transport system permease protein HrtB n=1 Tax=Enterococcus ureilyticus TaxID=1131292 RepID=A0A1E5HEU3_9ENTE|nr:ABC transporter permease [Enterococcus ureilyticus]MBM7687406.1 putative ABC transport system permease protein [Enterococcus ureilyticus]MBO0444737.1 ABC transporter permease [Enterococcus ureilyticus]OEG23459.1 ABC transporter permease [Enterococcus ureilyticus]